MPDGNGVTRTENEYGFIIEGEDHFVFVGRDAETGERYHSTWGQNAQGTIHYAESYVYFDEEDGGREQGTFVSIAGEEQLVHLTAIESDRTENDMSVFNYGTQVMNTVNMLNGEVYHFNNNDLTGFG